MRITQIQLGDATTVRQLQMQLMHLLLMQQIQLLLLFRISWPLKGSKASNWEGGVRGAAFVSGGALPASQHGRKLEEYIHATDWYAVYGEPLTLGLRIRPPLRKALLTHHLPWPIQVGDILSSCWHRPC